MGKNVKISFFWVSFWHGQIWWQSQVDSSSQVDWYQPRFWRRLDSKLNRLTSVSIKTTWSLPVGKPVPIFDYFYYDTILIINLNIIWLSMILNISASDMVKSYVINTNTIRLTDSISIFVARCLLINNFSFWIMCTIWQLKSDEFPAINFGF